MTRIVPSGGQGLSVSRIAESSLSKSTGPAEPPLISVVIVNYNAWSDVEALVGSLSGSPEVVAGAVEVLVVDNASSGPVPRFFLNPPRGVRLIVRRENGGFAVGVNSGWRASGGAWILLINPDVVVLDGWIGRVLQRVKASENRKQPGILGFALRNPDGSPQPSVGAFPSLVRALWEQLIPRSRRKYQVVWRTKSGSVDWVTGACILVQREVIEAVGGLDEDFFLYYEEVAFCRSAWNLGWQVEYDPDPSFAVVHLRPLQTRSVHPRIRVITRHSKLLYFRKHLPRWQFLGMCRIVAWEARVRKYLARLRGQKPERQAWDVIVGIERTLRLGGALGGRDVLALADTVNAPPQEVAGWTLSPRRGASPADEPRSEASLRG